MRILFMGTAELACPCLEALTRLPNHEVVGVVTQPDRPKGRDLRPAAPPVKKVADRLKLPVVQPEKIRDSQAVATLRDLRPELIVVVAYGQLLPRAVLELPPAGCVNVHASLLPRWRGAAPIQYAIWHGDRETGVTTMFLNEQMDAGDIILQRAESIGPDDTAATLHDRLARLGAGLLVETVGLIAAGQPPRIRQDDSRVTHARKLDKDAGRIDWTRPAVEIERQIRAFDPWPSAYMVYGGKLLKLWKAEVVPHVGGRPGEVLPGFVVATGAGGLKVLQVQPAGGRRMAADDFLRGHPLPAG